MISKPEFHVDFNFWTFIYVSQGLVFYMYFQHITIVKFKTY